MSLVATVTLEWFVLAEQSILGIAIVIEGDSLPVLLDVTGLTLFTIRAFVFVIFFVTGVAGCRSLDFVELSLMTAFASGCLVLAPQRVFRIPIVVERNGLPVLLEVTSFALFPEVPFVFVVFLVTGVAGRRSLLFVEVAFVTALTLGGRMFALEQVLGVAIVIENDRLPNRFHVTGLALRTKVPLVFVVLLVAGNTGCRGFFTGDWLLMAAFALNLGVLTLEWILRVLVMVKRGGLPILLTVTGLALGTEHALMVVILLVTGITIHRRVLVPFVGMTVFAFHLRMFATQQEAGLAVVKFIRCFLPAPFGVTIRASRA